MKIRDSFTFFFGFSFETDDGIKRDEDGTLANAGESEVIVVKGSYSFIAPDGKLYRVDYAADENGYRTLKNSEGVAPRLEPVEEPAKKLTSSLPKL